MVQVVWNTSIVGEGVAPCCSPFKMPSSDVIWWLSQQCCQKTHLQLRLSLVEYSFINPPSLMSISPHLCDTYQVQVLAIYLKLSKMKY